MKSMKLMRSKKRNISFSVSLFAIIAGIGLFASSGAHSQSYDIVDLGTLGGTQSDAYCINTAGQVVGRAQTETGAYHAFVWSPDTGMQDLGTLGGENSIAVSVNDSGVIVGLSEADSGGVRVFLVQDGVMRDLGIACPNLSLSVGINASGQIVGTALITRDRAFFWNDGNFTELGTLGGAYSYASDISDGSVIVGVSTTVEGTPLASLWYNGAVFTLGTLDGDVASVANRVNNTGLVAGYSMNADGIYHPVLFDTNAEMNMDLGTFGGDNGNALGISDAGVVVGHAQMVSGDFHAFVWDAVNGLNDLNDAIDPAAGWDYLYQANCLNAAGVISGFGYINGERHAFLLTPR